MTSSRRDHAASFKRLHDPGPVFTSDGAVAGPDFLVFLISGLIFGPDIWA